MPFQRARNPRYAQPMEKMPAIADKARAHGIGVTRTLIMQSASPMQLNKQNMPERMSEFVLAGTVFQYLADLCHLSMLMFPLNNRRAGRVNSTYLLAV